MAVMVDDGAINLKANRSGDSAEFGLKRLAFLAGWMVAGVRYLLDDTLV